jgi:hypothetical protein
MTRSDRDAVIVADRRERIADPFPIVADPFSSWSIEQQPSRRVPPYNQKRMATSFDNRSNASGLCVYCSQRAAVNREHVIARGFFPKPRPGGLPSVPACRECNAGRGDGGTTDLSADEEYVRTVMSAEVGATRHPDAIKLMTNEVTRSVNRSVLANTGFARMLADSLEVATARNDLGIILGQVGLMHVSVPRIVRVLQKITRGLFYYVHNRPLPPAIRPWVSATLSQQRAIPIRGLMDLMKHRTGWRCYGNQKTVCWYGATWGDPATSTQFMLLTVFYSRFVFYTDTVPREHGRPLLTPLAGEIRTAGETKAGAES